jgi:hypothetical protein
LESTDSTSHSNGEQALESSSQPGVGLSPATWAAASGVAKWVGEKAAGAIVGKIAGELFSKVMEAIGIGGPDLVGKLDQISDQLVEVQRSLDRLTEMTAEILKQLAELRDFMEKSLEIEALHGAIDAIDVAYDGSSASEALLQGGTRGGAIYLRQLTEEMPHMNPPATQKELEEAAQDFATYVSNMPLAITTIHTHLAKGVFDQASLLTHWARELAEQVKAGKVNRETAYLVLEGYFFRAVSVQLKGVTVHCVALGTRRLGPQFIRNFLLDNYAKTMLSQTAAFVEAVELLMVSTLAPSMTAGMGDGLGEREFPKNVDEILLRADLLCAALNLVGHKPDSAGKLSPSIQAAIQGIYGRALLRPSDLNNGIPPTIAPKGYSLAAGTAVRTLAFPCLDLVETAGRAVLKDASKSAVTVAHYRWPFPSPEPAVGTRIDPSMRGDVTPGRYPVFGTDQPSVLAAGLFDVSRLYRGLPSGARKTYEHSRFPGGYNDIGYYNERFSQRRHALVNDKEDAFETFFNVVNIWRANIQQHSYVKHPLFEYFGGKVKVRLTAFVAAIIRRDPRKDGHGGTGFAQRYEVMDYLKLRLPNGSEKQLFDSVLSFGVERPLSLNLGGGGWNDFYDPYECRRDGFFSVDFELEPGSYELILDNLVHFSEAQKRYEGWQSSSLAFFLHGLSIERV